MVASLRAMAVVVVVALGGTAHAGKIAVARVSAEPDLADEAGAVTLLVRSAFEGGDNVIVDAPAGTTAGGALAYLEQTGAEDAILMDLGRDGLKLRLTTVIVPRGATPIVHVGHAGDGDVGALARDAAGHIKTTLKLLDARVPDVSLGRLRPFAAALRLKASDPAGAADALRDAQPSTTLAVPAISTLLAGVPAGARDPSVGVVAAWSLGDTAHLQKLGAGTDDLAAAARALAALARSDLAAARGELGTKPPTNSRAILVGAILAEIAGDRKKLDEMVVQGVRSDRARAVLAFAASIGTFEKSTHAVLIEAAEKDAAFAPGVASQIGLAAAEAGVEVPRALALISARELDETELKRVEPFVATGTDATALRLRAEIALRRGDDRAAVAIGTFASLATDDPRSARYQGWLLASKGKYAEAAAQFAKAGARREQVRALTQANDSKTARGAIDGQPTTAEELVTVASIAISEGKLADAEKSLLAAEKGAPVNPLVQATLALLGQKQGNKDRVRFARLLANLQADTPTEPAPVIISAGSQQQPVGTAPEKVVIDLEGSDPRVIEPMLEALNLAQLAKKKIIIAELGWSPSVFSFRETHPDVVRGALLELLAAPPYDMQVAVAPRAFHGDTVELDSLVKLTGELDAALVFHLEADGGRARITLLLFVTGATQATQVSRDVRMAGAVTFNTVKLVILLGVVLLIALLGVFYFTRSMGTIELQIARAADTDEALCVEVTKRKSRPQIPDMLEFHNATKSAGAVTKRRSATLIASGLTMKVPTGSWYVHLYGTYSHAGKLRLVPDGCTQQVEVKRGAATEVAFDLVAREAEITVEVVAENQADVVVWVNDESLRRKLENGKVDLLLPVGHHTIHIQAGADELAMPLHVPTPKSMRMAVNVARELRLHKDLELGVDTEKAAELELVLSHGPRTPLPFKAVQDTVMAPQPKRQGRITGAPIVGNTVLGRYRIDKEVGRGAMGVVFRGWDEKLEREVAIKVMADDLRAIPEALQLFTAEAKALAQLNHTNIVAMYDQVTASDHVFMIMEYVDGQTLESIIGARGALPVFEAAGIVDQMCSGLAYAHARKVIHRDIKPANVFVANDKTVKLGDFGLARVMREVTIRRTEIRGTPLYMAPEQITGTDVDHRSDLYAIGCTLFELVCGHPPFIDGDILYAQMNTPPTVPSSITPGLPKALDALILALLAKNPDDRPGSASEVRTTLRDLSSG